jgi:lysophospholipase L1-like esterase
MHRPDCIVLVELRSGPSERAWVTVVVSVASALLQAGGGDVCAMGGVGRQDSEHVRPAAHRETDGGPVIAGRPQGLRRVICYAAGASLVAAFGAGLTLLELVLFRRFGSSPIPGPYGLDGTVSGGPGAVGLGRWVWLGDSLSAGVGANQPDESFPRQAATLVAQQVGCDIELICLAVSGAASADVLAVQVPAAVSILADGVVAVLAVGCNDVLRMVRPSAFRTTYTNILEALVATGASVVAIGVPDLAGMMVAMPEPLRTIVGWIGRRANNIIIDAATDTGAHYASISDGQLRGRRHRQPALAMLSADRWHPNGDGYRIWARLVGPRLGELTFAWDNST